MRDSDKSTTATIMAKARNEVRRWGVGRDTTPATSYQVSSLV